MMKVWNMVLISATFFLCILGTFLTRSGVVQSVHAFARSDIGKYFVTFLAVGIAATIYLILDRLDYLKSEAQLESVVSRESSFLFNNLILLASCFAVLWGTLFPVISEAVSGESNLARRRLVQPPDGAHRAVPAVPHRRGAAVCLAQDFARKPAAQFPVAGHCGAGAGGRAGGGGHAALLRADLVRLLPVRGADRDDGVLQGRAVHRRQERHEPAARHGGADAPQYAALRRLPGAHGDRADVHRLHRPRVQPERGEGTEQGRHHAGGRLRPEDGGPEAGRERELPVAPRHHAGFEERRSAGHAGTREALLSRPASRALRRWASGRGPTKTCT